MEPGIQRLCNELLDKAKGKTRIDLVDDYAYPVPVRAICKILGVPLKDEPQFHAWIYDFMAGLMDMGPDADTEEGKARKAKGQASAAALIQYLTNLIEGFIKKPADTLLSKMAHCDGPDGPMTPRETVTNAALLLVAGHDFTVNTISHCVLTVLRNAGSFELLRRRPELIPGAIEEVLRLQSAVQFFPSRSATADIEIAGTIIPKGSPVHLMYGAANRDPTAVPQPERIRSRTPGQSALRLGQRHPHLFRRSARAAGGECRTGDLRSPGREPRLVVDPPEYRRSNVFRGPRHLFVDFDGIRD